MRGEIDNEGYLSIERDGEMLHAFCPFAETKQGEKCGDWCALFSEPSWDKKGSKHEDPKIMLYLCHGKHHKFDELRDERH